MARRGSTLLAALCLWSACAFDRAPATPAEDLGGGEQDLSGLDQGEGDLNPGDLSGDLPTTDFSKDFDDIEDTQGDPDEGPDLSGWTREQCQEACARLQSCVGQVCDLSQQGDPEATLEACIQGCQRDAAFQAQLDLVRVRSCGQTNAELCRGADVRQSPSCQCPPTNLGQACDQGQGCFTAGPPAVCLESAGPLAFPGGYCTVLDCQDDATCEGGGCVTLVISDQQRSVCLERCGVAAPGCREGYGCWALDDTNGRGACLPACAGDTCAQGQACLRGGCVQALTCDEQTPCADGLACLNGICVTP